MSFSSLKQLPWQRDRALTVLLQALANVLFAGASGSAQAVTQRRVLLLKFIQAEARADSELAVSFAITNEVALGVRAAHFGFLLALEGCIQHQVSFEQNAKSASRELAEAAFVEKMKKDHFSWLDSLRNFTVLVSRVFCVSGHAAKNSTRARNCAHVMFFLEQENLLSLDSLFREIGVFALTRCRQLMHGEKRQQQLQEVPVLLDDDGDAVGVTPTRPSWTSTLFADLVPTLSSVDLELARHGSVRDRTVRLSRLFFGRSVSENTSAAYEARTSLLRTFFESLTDATGAHTASQLDLSSTPLPASAVAAALNAAVKKLYLDVLRDGAGSTHGGRGGENSPTLHRRMSTSQMLDPALFSGLVDFLFDVKKPKWLVEKHALIPEPLDAAAITEEARASLVARRNGHHNPGSRRAAESTRWKRAQKAVRVFRASGCVSIMDVIEELGYRAMRRTSARAGVKRAQRKKRYKAPSGSEIPITAVKDLF